MTEPDEKPSPDRAGRTLIKAFTFAGAILGVGLFGLAKTLVMLGIELGWWSTRLQLWRAGWWILLGAVLGLGAGCLLVRMRRRL